MRLLLQVQKLSILAQKRTLNGFKNTTYYFKHKFLF